MLLKPGNGRRTECRGKGPRVGVGGVFKVWGGRTGAFKMHCLYLLLCYTNILVFRLNGISVDSRMVGWE